MNEAREALLNMNKRIIFAKGQLLLFLHQIIEFILMIIIIVSLGSN